jgi:hypothetical protein
VRQDPEPLAQQGIDVTRAQGGADRLQRGRVVAGSKAVVQGLKADAGLGRLPLGPVVSVDAQLGVEREVTAELQEERAEVGVHAIEIKVVDHGTGLHQPGIGRPVRATALLGAPHHRLLLPAPDVQDPLPAGEPGQVPLGEVVLAFLAEVHQIQAVRLSEVVNVRDEGLGHRIHQRCRGELITPVPDEEDRDPAAVLQPGLIDVQVHPVDALDFQHHVIGQDVSS